MPSRRSPISPRIQVLVVGLEVGDDRGSARPHDARDFPRGAVDVGQVVPHQVRERGIDLIGVDPLQALMEGYEVKTLDDVVATADVFVTTTGNYNIITADHMAKMKHNGIVGNIGHFDNEIDMAGLAKTPGIVKENVKNPQEHGNQVDRWNFADGHSIIVLAEGRLLNLGCATGHPSFVMSNSFSNQVIAQIELFHNTGNYDKGVYVLPKHLDEKVARLHLGKLGAKLTTLTAQQADYIGVPVGGPYKPSHYRY